MNVVNEKSNHIRWLHVWRMHYTRCLCLFLCVCIVYLVYTQNTHRSMHTVLEHSADLTSIIAIRLESIAFKWPEQNNNNNNNNLVQNILTQHEFKLTNTIQCEWSNHIDRKYVYVHYDDYYSHGAVSITHIYTKTAKQKTGTWAAFSSDWINNWWWVFELSLPLRRLHIFSSLVYEIVIILLHANRQCY